MAIPSFLRALRNAAHIGEASANDASSTTATTANADGSVLERQEYVQAGLPGSPWVLSVTVTSSDIPNNTQTAGALTGAASGALLVEGMVIETGATGLAGPTNIEISTDNVKGLTGAGAPNVTTAISGLGANKTVNIRDASGEVVPFVLESGKKIYIDGDDGAGTGAGTARITFYGRRITANASLAAGGIGS